MMEGGSRELYYAFFCQDFMAQFARRQIFPLCFPLLPRGINMGESREREGKISVRYPVSHTQPVFPAFANCASRETPLKSDGKHSLFQYLHRHHRIKQRVETGRKQTPLNSVQAGEEEEEEDFVYYLQLSSPRHPGGGKATTGKRKGGGATHVQWGGGWGGIPLG